LFLLNYLLSKKISQVTSGNKFTPHSSIQIKNPSQTSIDFVTGKNVYKIPKTVKSVKNQSTALYQPEIRLI